VALDSFREGMIDGFSLGNYLLSPISTAGKLINLFWFLTRDFLRICCCEPPGD
jgi:hypothetical protein